MAKNQSKRPRLKVTEPDKTAEPKKIAAKKEARIMSDELARIEPQVLTEKPEPVLAEAPRAAIESASRKGADMSEKNNGEKMFDSFSKVSESFNLDGVKKAAAWYIDSSEKFATQALELQEKATSWAKDTPLAPIFEAQQAIAKKMLERSVSVARNLWQIQE